jgi:hypothetical protein
VCTENTSEPLFEGFCGDILTFAHRCSPFQGFSVPLDECGPVPGNAFQPLCQRTEKLVACLNPIAFSTVCGGCNPCQIGIIGVDVSW